MRTDTRSTTVPQRMAMALAVVLWAVGSAYLIQSEWRHAEPDWIVIVATPALWAAVISLPIMAHHAWSERHYFAAVLLAVAAIVGTAYTLNGTIGRQAEARESKALEAEASGEGRKLLETELKRTRMQLASASRDADGACRKASWTDNCKNHRNREAAYQARIDQLIGEIATSAPPKPKDSGTSKVTMALSLILGQPKSAIEPWVSTFSDALLGLLLELGALALGYYAMGPRDKRNTAASTLLTGTPTTPVSISRISFRHPTPTGGMRDEALADLKLLLKRGTPIESQDQLAERWGRSKGWVSLRLKEWEAAGEIPARVAAGRCKTFEAA